MYWLKGGPTDVGAADEGEFGQAVRRAALDGGAALDKLSLGRRMERHMFVWMQHIESLCPLKAAWLCLRRPHALPAWGWEM